jgi:hypothetical protein
MYGEEPAPVGRVYVDWPRSRRRGERVRDRLKLAPNRFGHLRGRRESRSWKIIPPRLHTARLHRRGEHGRTRTDAKTLATQTIDTLRKKPQADIPALEEELRVALRRFFTRSLTANR